jgi:hypothetical protein
MMKSKVIDRPMFKKKGPPVPPEDVNNVGIMQGFMDQVSMMDDMEGEEDDDDEMEMGKMMDRRPDSPEILMNNLRGDMRSVDARVEELADLVGYRAASETPTEVLALLQPVLAQQGAMVQPPPQMAMPAQANPMAAPAGGVADLAAMAQGPQTAPPMPMPEAPPPGGIGSLPAAAEQQAPIAMKNGGIVQRFKDGSDEDGVTPATDTSYMSLPPELVAKARQALMTPSSTLPVPELAVDAPKKAAAYRQLLGGGSKELTQAQMLFDIAQGALNVAAGVDAEGNRIRGNVSPIARIAAGIRNVPALIGARAAELQKQDRAINLAALEATEKQIGSTLEYNARVIESNRKRFETVLSKSGLGNLFGKGDWEYRIITEPGALSNWAMGKTTEQQNNVIEAALTKLATPRVETRTDPITNQPYTVTMPVYMPPHVKQAAKVYRDRTGTDFFKALGVDINLATGGGGTRPSGDGAPPEAKGAAGPAEPSITVKQGKQNVPYFWQSPTSGNPTLYNLAGKGTGVVNIVGAFVKTLPFGLDQIAGEEEQITATSFLKQAEGRINLALRTNPRFTDAERVAIETKLEISPNMIDNPSAYRLRLRSLDDLLLNIRKESYKVGYGGQKLAPETIRAAREKINDVDAIRKLVGLPPPNAKVLQSKDQWDKAPSGSMWIVADPSTGAEQILTKP